MHDFIVSRALATMRGREGVEHFCRDSDFSL